MRKVASLAGSDIAVIVAAGDILVPAESIPNQFPLADVTIVTMECPAEVATGFGVCILDDQGRVQSFLQKPRVSDLQEKRFEVDTGLWLLSGRAAALLRQLSKSQTGTFRRYELYADFGLSLGREPVGSNHDIANLVCRTLRIEGEFLHIGTSRQLLDHFARSGFTSRSKLNGHEIPPRVWVDGCELASGWRLHGDTILTNVVQEIPGIAIPAGIGIDFVPLTGGRIAVRAYGIDDPFSGRISDPGTKYMGVPFRTWFERRGLSMGDFRESPDIHDFPLFPIFEPGTITASFLHWLVTGEAAEDQTAAFGQLPKLSGAQLAKACDILGLISRLDRLDAECALSDLQLRPGDSIDQIDFVALKASDVQGVPQILASANVNRPTLTSAGIEMAKCEWFVGHDQEAKSAAFLNLRDAMLSASDLRVQPTIHGDRDSVVVAQCPIRLDLAGAWSDTPPYCLSRGGEVVNAAATLGGQRPVTTYLRHIAEPCIRLASIDAGHHTQISSLTELLAAREESPDFALVRCCLRLAGFDPSFQREPESDIVTLLNRMGGGFSLTTSALTPTGSGLGTSSILAAATLACLSEAFHLEWTTDEIAHRTLIAEQLLGSGGGWQDQWGGIVPGIKFLKAEAAIEPKIFVAPLPGELFERMISEGSLLLYDTGLTRTAFSVLGKIVSGMFLNDRHILGTLDEIRLNAVAMNSAMSNLDAVAFGESLAQTWNLKCRLDSGSCPSQVSSLVTLIEPYCRGASLLGAGGGGYMLIAAKSASHGSDLSRALEGQPGEFVDFSICKQGLTVSRHRA